VAWSSEPGASSSPRRVEPPGASVQVVFEGPSLAYKDFPYRFAWTRGEVSVQGGQVTIVSGEGRDGNLQVHLTGTITLPGFPTRVALRVEGTKGTLSQKLRACLPEKYHQLWDDLRPNGQLNFSGTITATVVEVLPNGHMVVTGEKQIGENQNVDVLRFSGTIDPKAVQPGNVVSSNKVANARMESRGRGAQAEAQTVGLLTRFFFSFLPF